MGRSATSRARGFLAVLVAGLCGCATIFSGSSQKIQVNSTPAGARVTVQPGNITGTTPTNLTLRRNENGYRLRFEHEGFEPVDVRIESTTNGWVYGNILIGGLIGLLIDYSSGAAYTLTPDEVAANLAPGQAKSGVLGGNDLVVFDASGALLAKISLE